jgi:hypothetical protein
MSESHLDTDQDHEDNDPEEPEFLGPHNSESPGNWMWLKVLTDI